MHLPLGNHITMTVLRKIETGYVLDKDEQEALLHHNETDRELKEGEEVEVFLYSDKKGNIAATTTLPTVTTINYDWAEVVEVLPKLGAFVHIGIAKEILVSNDDLPKFRSIWPKIGDKLFVRLDLDYKNRLIALPATGGVIAEYYEVAPEHLLNKKLSGRVYYSSREGSEVFTEDNYRGFIHHTERKTEPRLGELITGRVIDVKEDGTINISLRPVKKESIPLDAEDILQHLEASGGVIPFSDKSDPEAIRSTFKMSKAAFKRALGKLMKEGKVEQRDGKTFLL
ncbi:CvfB family protein [Oceanobacillus alkalisoli]|uniref:CvfB family protein n=1 Tax=Oceanobacillus alkalisoli TaxID=2925113 RepID=UPI001EEFDADD|nr:S1-like domain-containing RNA-binding protein [Oceanobacillus alkalisoli]MCF3944434.1 S1-like domain-containing RNA-binding protein [Oceanobacillus alkalisoli]MCG5102105.1 S1-like domain-containing RNA-binding protein [Oceanobacillus alkalisoli]